MHFIQQTKKKDLAETQNSSIQNYIFRYFFEFLNLLGYPPIQKKVLTIDFSVVIKRKY